MKSTSLFFNSLLGFSEIDICSRLNRLTLMGQCQVAAKGYGRLEPLHQNNHLPQRHPKDQVMIVCVVLCCGNCFVLSAWVCDLPDLGGEKPLALSHTCLSRGSSWKQENNIIHWLRITKNLWLGYVSAEKRSPSAQAEIWERPPDILLLTTTCSMG